MRLKTTISILAVALASISAPAFAQTAAPAAAPAETDQNAAIMAFFAEYDAD
jgi:hypothetical protein